jgi:hypothetical protein
VTPGRPFFTGQFMAREIARRVLLAVPALDTRLEVVAEIGGAGGRVVRIALAESDRSVSVRLKVRALYWGSVDDAAVRRRIRRAVGVLPQRARRDPEFPSPEEERRAAEAVAAHLAAWGRILKGERVQ